MKALSLYSGGCDGMSLAASWLGIETVAYCDSELACRAVLAARHPDAPIFSSDEDVTPDGLRAVGVEPAGIDLVMGGPPCQCASVAGKRLGAADPRNRWPQYLRIVCEVKPRWIMAENSPGLLTVDDGRLYGDILRGLAEAGYNVCWDCWGAADVGAPHQRDRLFILGELADASCGGCDDRGDYLGARPIPPEPKREYSQGQPARDGGECRAGEDGNPFEQLADTPSAGLSQPNAAGISESAEESSAGMDDGFERRGSNVADAERQRLPGSRQYVAADYSAQDEDWEAAQSIDGCLANKRRIEPGLGRSFDGVRAWLDEAARRLESQRWPKGRGPDQYDWEPPRVALGVPHRAERITMIGNSCPPQQYLVALTAIREADEIERGVNA